MAASINSDPGNPYTIGMLALAQRGHGGGLGMP
jgi:hypothetical protein